MKRGRGSQIFFGGALVALTALGVWWTVFISQAVELEREAKLCVLRDAAALAALEAGYATTAPAPGPVVGDPRLEWVPTLSRASGDLAVPAAPGHPELSIRPLPERIEGIRHKAVRRRVMIIGESSLLFILLGVCTAMLYRLVRQERRNVDKMEAFVSAVTHEMKTPVAGVKSLLQTMAAGRIPEEQQPRLVALGLKETERLQHSIENVLLVGSLRTDRLEVRVENMALNPLLEAFLEHRRPAMVDRPDAIRLVWEEESGECAVVADASAVRVILENLTDNALKYGGEDPAVTLRVSSDDSAVRIAVGDHGIGFASHRAESLFAPFHRDLEHEDAVEHGTGLGLSIARTLARRMGGDLTAASPGLGQGSTFTLTLRAAVPESGE